MRQKYLKYTKIFQKNHNKIKGNPVFSAESLQKAKDLFITQSPKKGTRITAPKDIGYCDIKGNKIC